MLRARAAGRTCMDWSQRRLHLAGALGRNLAESLLTRQLLQRDPKSRAPQHFYRSGAPTAGSATEVRDFSPSADPNELVNASRFNFPV